MKLLHLSANPHVHDRVTSAELMRDVVIAMLPTAIYGVLQWGFHALLVVVLTTLMAVFTEFAYQKAMKQRYDFGLKLSSRNSLLDSYVGIRVCHYCGKAALRRIGGQLYESCFGSSLLPADFLCRKDDCFQQCRGRRHCHRNPSCNFKNNSGCQHESDGYVCGKNSGNHRRGIQDLSFDRCFIPDCSEGYFSEDAFDLYRNSSAVYPDFLRKRI